MDGRTCGETRGNRLGFFPLCEPASASHASIAVRKTGIQALNLTNEEY